MRPTLVMVSSARPLLAHGGQDGAHVGRRQAAHAPMSELGHDVYAQPTGVLDFVRGLQRGCSASSQISANARLEGGASALGLGRGPGIELGYEGGGPATGLVEGASAGDLAEPG